MPPKSQMSITHSTDDAFLEYHMFLRYCLLIGVSDNNMLSKGVCWLCLQSILELGEN